MTTWESIFQVIGVIASVVSIVGAGIWVLGRRKVLAFKRVLDLRVLDTPSAERVTVLLDGIPIEEPIIAVVRVWNAGFSTIFPQDFAEPLRVIPTLSASFTVTSFAGINAPAPSYRIEEPAVVIENPLFARGQGFELRLLMSGLAGIAAVGRLHNGYIENFDVGSLRRWWYRARQRLRGALRSQS